MCYGCYQFYGKPEIINDLTKTAADLINRVVSQQESGGNLHIVIEDWNLEDEHINSCLKWIKAGGFSGGDSPNQLRIEAECAETLKLMTVAERASALAIHEGFTFVARGLRANPSPSA